MSSHIGMSQKVKEKKKKEKKKKYVIKTSTCDIFNAILNDNSNKKLLVQKCKSISAQSEVQVCVIRRQHQSRGV